LILWSVSESIARQPPEIDRDRETKAGKKYIVKLGAELWRSKFSSR